MKNVHSKSQGKYASFFNEHSIYFFILGLLVVITFFNSLFNAFVSDDIDIMKGLGSTNFVTQMTTAYPSYLRSLIIFIIHSMFGATPLPYRLITIVFHFLTVLLLYLLSFLLTKKKNVAFLISAVFAVHPVISEPVIWIAAGGYPQFTFFYFLTFICYLVSKKNKNLYWLSLVLFFFATESEKAVMFPFIILIYEWLFGDIKKNWKKALGFFLIIVFRGVFYIPAIFFRQQQLQTNFYIGTAGENPFLKIPFAFTSYLQLFIWPARLTLYHSETMSVPEFIVRCVVMMLFLISMIFSYKKNKLIFFGQVFFLVNLVPVLLPLKISSTVAERYVYMPIFGIILASVVLLDKLISQLKIKTYFYVIGSIVIVCLMVRTMVRNADWATPLSFWTSTVKASPNAFAPHNNLGVEYSQEGNLQAAVDQFKIASELNPLDADSRKNIGYILMTVGRYDDALYYYNEAYKRNETKWNTVNDIGAVYLAKKDYSTAEKYFLKALSMSPNNAFIVRNLANLYLTSKQKEKAIAALQQYIALDPTNEDAKTALLKLTTK